MQKLIFTTALTLILSFIVISQTTKTNMDIWEQNDDGDYGCTFDLDGGHINMLEKGEITQIVDSNSLIFENEKGQKRKVNLIAVNPKLSQKRAKSFLEQHVLNKDAELIFSSSQLRSKNVNGIVKINAKDVNRVMLERGLAAYKDSKAYQISHFDNCVYFRSQDKAKSNKLGIWTK